MRRNLLLGVMVAVLVAIALPAMAAPTLTTNGEITYGFTSNGTTTVDGWPNAYLNLTTTFDPNNSFVISFYGNNLPKIGGVNVENGALESSAGTGLSTPNSTIEDIYAKTDIGGDLGLDTKTIDPVLYAGFGVYDLPDYNVTIDGPEGIAALGIDKGNADGIFGAEAGSAYGLISLDTNILNMVHVVVATSGTGFTATNNEGLLGLYGTVLGSLNFEAGWAPHNSASGYIPLGLQYTYKMGDLALTGMAQYVANLNTNGVSNWAAGLKAVYMGSYTIDFAVLSYEPAYEPATAAVKALGDIQVNVTPNAGIVLSPLFNFDPNAATAFDSAEMFVWYKFGSVTTRLGYDYETNGAHFLGFNDYSVSNGTNGGVWLTVDLSF